MEKIELEPLVATLYAEGYRIEEILDIVNKKVFNNKMTDQLKEKVRNIYDGYINTKPDVLCSSYDLEETKKNNR